MIHPVRRMNTFTAYALKIPIRRGDGAVCLRYAGKDESGYLRDSTTDYAKGLTEAFEKQFTKLGGTIVAKENYVSKDTEFSSVLTKIKGSDF